MSIAWRFTTLFAFISCFVCKWHVFAFLALVGCQHGMATPGHRLGFSLLKCVAAGELLFHWWLQGVYMCVRVCRTYIIRLQRQALNTECDQAYANKSHSECTVAQYMAYIAVKLSCPTPPTCFIDHNILKLCPLTLHFKCKT